jgi:hypothetical protein
MWIYIVDVYFISQMVSAFIFIYIINMSIIALFFAAFPSASAQNCSSNLLVDDFRVGSLKPCTVCDSTNPLRYFNLLQGDYGAKDANSILP